MPGGVAQREVNSAGLRITLCQCGLGAELPQLAVL